MDLNEYYRSIAQSQAQGNYWTSTNQISNQPDQEILNKLMRDVGSYGKPLGLLNYKDPTPQQVPAYAQTSNRNLLVLLTDI